MKSEDERRILAFIGVGKMGGAFARLMHDQGFEVVAWDPNPTVLAAGEGEVWKAAPDPATAAAIGDVVFTSVPRPADLLGLYVERDDVASALRPGTTCVDISTVDPSTVRMVEDRLGEHGIGFVAAPVGKGPAQAREGTAPLFVGGANDVVDLVRPILARMTVKIHDLGTVEGAAACKLISNYIGMTNLAVLSEGFRIAQAFKISPDAFAEALSETGSASYQLEKRLPLIVAGDYVARFSVEMAIKDVALTISAAESANVPTTVGRSALERYRAAASAGFGDEEVTAVYKVTA